MAGDSRLRALLAAPARFPLIQSLVLGALAATGFAPLESWVVTLACLAAWLGLIHRAPTLRRALLTGWLFGVGHFTLANNWIQHAFVYQTAMPQWIGYLAVFLLALYLAVYPMLAAGLAWRLRGRVPDTAFVLAAGGGWTVTEYLRGTLFTGYPWDPLAVIWLPWIAVARTSAWIGTYALSGLTVVAAGAILLAVQRRWRMPAVVLAALLAIALANGDEAPPPAAPASAPHVVVIQPNLGEEVRETPDYNEHKFETLARLSGTPGPAPRLILWPEGGIEMPLENGYPTYAYIQLGSAYEMRARVAALLGDRDMLLTGGSAFHFDRSDDMDSAANAIFAIGPDAHLHGRYDKAHLVPYGEYLPARPLLSLLGLSRLVPGDLDFTSGPGPRSLPLPGFGAIGMQICYEIVFSGQVIDEAHRPRLLFNPSNDAWFGSWGPPQHLAQARLRAIEEGLPVIRSTPTGISAVVAADGRILAALPLGRAGTIDLPIPASLPPTLFSKLGNIAALGVALLLGLAAIAIRRRAR